MTTTFHNRLHFAAVLRRAIREGRLVEYAKHSYGYARMASLADGTYLLYKGPIGVQIDERVKGDDDGREYSDPRDRMDEVRRG